MRNKQGFTLIEIMIVIVIVGITFGFALIAFGDFGESKRILFAGEQLTHTIKIAQQQALLESTTLGLNINNSGYQFVQLQNDSRWIIPNSNKLFKFHHFPDNTIINLKTKQRVPRGFPAIIITSSGDMSPFTLNFASLKENKIASLSVFSNGDLKFQVSGAE